jgi:KaiC/GvpD/RAD55 family RecA-like ATPase
VIDSVSSLLMNTNPQMAFKFLEIVNAKIREFGGIGVWILEEGIHDEQTVNTLKYLCDSVMEFKLEGNKRYIRIARMRGTRHEADWYEFRITDEGLEVRK